MELNHFTYGWVKQALAYGISFLGSLLGLICTARARGYRYTGSSPTRWLVLAAVAIGGTGIWLMHFMAMLGFTVVEDNVRYDLPITIASALAAIGVVGVGLFRLRPRSSASRSAACTTPAWRRSWSTSGRASHRSPAPSRSAS
jgi:NO-binding membrane sensor protein with MHYT domain